MRYERPEGMPQPRRIRRRAFLQLLGVATPAFALAIGEPRPRTWREAATKAGESSRVDQAPPVALESPDLVAQQPYPDAVPDPASEIPRTPVEYSNPIVAGNCPDPHVLHVDGTFYMVSTSHVLPAFPIRASTNLVDWHAMGVSVFTRANRPKWATGPFWAPELHHVGEYYVVYYTARSRVTGRLCIGAAVARDPIGPYRDIGRPIISTSVTVLDSTFFRDDDGRQYLYWKADAGPGDPSGPICVQELRADGLKVTGDRLEVARDDLPWEERLIEAPAILKRGEFYYLFYSGGAFNSRSYAVGVARSTSPISGFEKRGEPILRGSDEWHGPGHNSIVSHEGNDYIVYHAWEGERFQDVRPGLIDRIEWGEDGWPTINEGTPGGRRSP